MNVIFIILFGLFGGLIRSFVGIIKHGVLRGRERFDTKKFLFSAILSSCIGAFCALLTLADYRLILLAGYAGTDLIQGVYKITK